MEPEKDIIEPVACPEACELNEVDQMIIQMLHKKCAVIQQARSQMTNLDKKFNRHIEALKSRNTMPARLWQRRFCILIFLTIILLAWLSIMYGAVLGSIICTGQYKGCYYFKPLFRIPGLNWTQNSEIQGKYRIF